MGSVRQKLEAMRRSYIVRVQARWREAQASGENLEYERRLYRWHMARIAKGAGSDMSYTEAGELLELKKSLN